MRFAESRMRAGAVAALAACALLGTVRAAAQTPPAATASAAEPIALAVQTEKLVVAADGSSALTVATSAVPGDTLIYTVAFTNATEAALDRVRITQPIPPGVVYVAGTAVAPGAVVLFSVDGGATFGLPGELTVTGDDGARRAAAASDYTHVRWLLAAPLEARATGFARFQAELR